MERGSSPRHAKVVESHPMNGILEPLVDDWRIGGSRNAVQVDDLAVHHQLDVDGLFPVFLRIFPVGDRVLTHRRSVDANPGGGLVTQPETRTPPQNDSDCGFGSSDDFEFQLSSGELLQSGIDLEKAR